MIIFGTRGINSTIGNGSFHCPQCAAEQPYTHKAVKRFFTLYFIPLIPMGTAGEFIECSGCAGTYAPEILTYDPEAERQQTTALFRRLSVAFLLDLNRCRAAELEALQDVVGDLGNIDIESEDIANDVRQAQEAGVDLLKYLKKQSADLSDDGKWLVLATYRRILERVNPLMPHEKDRLAEIGKTLGLRKKHVTEFLETPMGA